ncbi:MFS transporter [Pikeienuella piscinae]|uniref:MFS transporter n=1 Tax=Pikeienuella piscinae TaxID=2748098 RepID=A0A7M3T6J2_9RHOB|nr:MFS transporter [Pikeienuella piscinae]QIE57623.1 MFS transporter [Pikeienuella piscinae]
MSDASVLDSRYSWWRLFLTLVIGSVSSVGIWTFISILPAVQAEFGGGRGASTVPYVLTMVGFALGSLFVGQLVDRFGVTLSLIGAALTLGAGFALSTIAPSLGALTAIHFFIGVGSSAGFGPLMADISHWFMRRRGLAVTAAASGNYIAGALWPWALSDILAAEGWRVYYLALAAIVVCTVIPLALLLRRRAPEAAMAAAGERARAAAMSAGLSPRVLQWLLILAGLACCMAMSMPQVHIVAYCVDLGYGPAVGAEMLSLMLLGGVASRLASGLLADWIGGLKTLLIGSTLQCIALMLYIPYDGLAPLYVVSLIFGLSQGGLVPSYAIIVREYLPPAEAGARVGVVIMSTIFGMALGGWSSGWIYDLTGSYTAAFINGVAWNFVNLAIALAILLRSRPRAPRAAVSPA